MALDPVTLLIGVGLGLVLAGVLRAIWAFAPDRAPRADADGPFAWDPERDEGPEAARAPAQEPELAETPTRAGAAGSVRAGHLAVEIRLPPELIEPAAVRPRREPAEREAGPRPPPEALRISARVVLHLARLGRYGPDEIAPAGATQSGMTEALGVRQSTLTKVLTRLVAAGALEASRAHVQGGARRLKVYRLTPLGEAISRDLRRPGPGGTVRAPPVVRAP